MTIPMWVVWWFIGFVVITGYFLMFGDEFADAKPLVAGIFIWPITIVLMVGLVLLDKSKIRFDIVEHGTDKKFGFRKPLNEKVIGFAMIILKYEFQFWRDRKVQSL